jgi:hypothetical protein
MKAARLPAFGFLLAAVGGCEAVSGLDQLTVCADGCDAAPPTISARSSTLPASDGGAESEGMGFDDARTAREPAVRETGSGPMGSAQGDDSGATMDSEGGPSETNPDSGVAYVTDGSACLPSACPTCNNPLEPIRCCTSSNVCGCTPNLLGLFCQ